MRLWVPVLAAALLAVVPASVPAQDDALVYYLEEPRPLPPDLALRSGERTLRLGELRGRALLVGFGYTHCPDVCPATMAVFTQTLRLLDGDTRSRVQAVFISVDTLRDTPQTVAEYTRYFHPGILGATGSPREVMALARAFGAGYVVSRGDGGEVLVDHTASSFLVDPEGRLVGIVPFNTPPQMIADALRRIVR